MARRDMAASDATSPIQALEAAVGHHRAGRLADAERLYRAVLQARPQHPDANHNLGVIAVQSGRADLALPYLKAALDANPANGQHWVSYADALLAVGLAQQARAVLEQGAARGLSGPAVDDVSKRIAERLGLAAAVRDLDARANGLRQAGRFAESLALSRRALCLDPAHADSLHTLGLIAYETGRTDLSARTIGRAIHSNGRQAVYHANLALALLDLQRFEEASARCKAALSLAPERFGAFANLGATCQQLGRLPEAAHCYGRALTIKPDIPETLASLGNALRDSGKLDVAISRYQRALALSPANPEIMSGLATALWGQGQLDGALVSYQRILVLTPDEVDLRINIGTLLVEKGDLAGASACADAAGRHSGLSPLGQYSLGLLMAKCHRLEEAKRFLSDYLASDPEDQFGARLVLARLGLAPMPERASEAQMKAIYAQRSQFWDNNVESSYRGHELVASAFASNSSGALTDILDAGCGTGLVGQLVRDRARRLDGVDISSDMLEKAKAKAVYDDLVQEELVGYFEKQANRYDAILSAATLIHFGDLSPVFKAAAVCLRSDGLFVFTLFPNEDEGEGQEVVPGSLNGIGAKGCYLHGRGYVTKLAKETGFAVVSMATEIHEYRRGAGAPGLVVVLRRRSGPQAL